MLCFSHANDNDHGGHRGNTTGALAQWQRLVASRDTTILLHCAMLIVLYRPGNMFIDIAIKLVTFVYIIDNSAARKKIISPSFLQFS